jgi:hypothetical protein
VTSTAVANEVSVVISRSSSLAVRSRRGTAKPTWFASGTGSSSAEPGQALRVAKYEVNERGVAKARQLIDARRYVLRSEWSAVQPRAEDQNAFLDRHPWDEYAEWHLGLTVGANDDTKARYAFVYGDFRRLHRMGLISAHYRAAEWGHKEIELAAHDLLQYLDSRRR